MIKKLIFLEIIFNPWLVLYIYNFRIFNQDWIVYYVKYKISIEMKYLNIKWYKNKYKIKYYFNEFQYKIELAYYDKILYLLKKKDYFILIFTIINNIIINN